MDRLTGKHYDRGDYYMVCSGRCANDDEMCGGCPWLEKIINRLGAYEDTGLEPETCAEYKKFEDEAVSKGVTFKRIIELMEAEKDGRLVVLPCKVGDTVYIASSTRGVYEAKVRTLFCGHCGYSGDFSPDVRMIRTTSCDIPMEDFNKTVFLTREEAEAAMREKGELGAGISTMTTERTGLPTATSRRRTEMTVAEWRKRNKKCKFCVHCVYKDLPPCFPSVFWCNAKMKVVDEEIPRIFCKVFKSREV